MRISLLLGILCVASLNAQQTGEQIYKTQCATCHDNAAQSRAPDRATLAQRTAAAAVASLTTGTMAVQGAALTPADKQAVAEYVTGKKLVVEGATAAAGLCKVATPMADPASKPLWNGAGADVEQTHSESAKAAGLTAEQIPNLKLKWAFAFPNGSQAFAQPSIAGGRVFIGSDKGMVYSLDAATGCTYWSFQAGAGVRAGISVATMKAGAVKYIAMFGDLQANVYGVNAQTGELLWKSKMDDHKYARVTGAPVWNADRLYVPVSSVEEIPAAGATYECCTFRGSVVALDVATGKQIWKSYTIPDAPQDTKKTSKGTQLHAPAGAAVWGAPTLDLKTRSIYVGTGNSYTEPAVPTSDSVVAFNMDTGKMLWVSQHHPADAFVVSCRPGNENCPEHVGPDYDFGTSPALRTLPGGKRILVIGQKSSVGWGLDPDNKGAVLWEYKAGSGGPLGGIEWGVAADETNGYFPVCDRTPPGPPGGLHAVNLKTGQRTWYAPPVKADCAGRGGGCSAAQSAAIAVIPGAVFSGSVDGHFRAYSTKDGAVIWDFDTVKDYETVNQIKGSGGSIDGAGPAIAGGMVFTNSGYSQWGAKAGNVLLAFAP